MKKFLLLLLSLSLLLAASSVAAAPAKVLGKINLKAGQAVAILVNSRTVVRAVAYEDQTFYITEKIIVEGELLGYAADATGFVHNCPQHGREPLPSSWKLEILIRKSDIESGTYDIEFFKES
jgi:hypothetical protein